MVVYVNNFTIKRSIQDLWGFVNNFKDLISCLSVVEKADFPDPDTVDGVIATKIGMVPMRINAKYKVVERIPPHTIRAQGKGMIGQAGALFKGGEIRMNLTLNLKEVSPNETSGAFKMEVEADPEIRRIVDAVMKGKVPQEAEGFIKTLKAKLEK